MDQPGLPGRYLDRNGEIDGKTLVRSWRRAYGPGLAEAFPVNETLDDLLASLDDATLSKLMDNHEHERRAGTIGPA
jgi:hypothetical protein